MSLPSIFTPLGSFAATLLSLLVLPVQAEVLQVIDQQGRPVADAVISFPSQPQAVPDVHAVIDQVDKQFSPHVVVVQKGQWVNFPNSDDIRHHVYSFSDPKTFEMRLFSGTDAEPQLFDRSGIVVLGCNIHDEMRGFIYVAEQENTAITDKDGMAVIEVSEDSFHVWHERLSTSQTERVAFGTDALIKGSPRQIRITLLDDAQEEEDARTFRSRKFGRD